MYSLSFLTKVTASKAAATAMDGVTECDPEVTCKVVNGNGLVPYWQRTVNESRSSMNAMDNCCNMAPVAQSATCKLGKMIASP